MNRVKSVVGVLTLALLFSGILAGQDKKTDGKKATDKKTAKSKGRMPAYYGKLNLKDDQKEKILAIKAEYAPKIAELSRQLKELRKKQSDAFEKVLTSAQKKQLHDTLAAKKKGKKASSSKDKKASSSTEKKKKSRKKKKDSKGSKSEDKKDTDSSDK